MRRNTQTPRIYMDFAAATPCSKVAARAMAQVSDVYANPGAPHTDGLAARKILDGARAEIARVLAVKPQEIIFTSGATEANNLALFGVAKAHFQKTGTRGHVIVSAIEHSSVLEVCHSDEFMRYADVTEIRPDEHGCIRPSALLAALTPQTCLVSIGWANGEIGTIQPMRSLSQVIRAYEKETHTNIVFHSDAGQASWAVSPQPHGVGLDVVTVASAKLYGPRGVAALFVRHGVSLARTVYGGLQERGIRPGTEDPILATGFAAACSELDAQRATHFKSMRALRAHFIESVQKHIEGVQINGTYSDQLPHVLNISVPRIDSEYVMYALDHAGIAMSTKSICLLESGDPISPVVATLGGEGWRATNTLRFSWGRETTLKDIKTVSATLVRIVEQYHARTE
jgi:cysteine desulfurase